MYIEKVVQLCELGNIAVGKTIRRLMSNFLEHRTVEDHRQVIHKRLRHSNYRAHHFGVSGTTLPRILKEDLHLFPCEVQLTQRTLSTDGPRCVKYGQTVARIVETQPDFWKKISMTVEVHFTLLGAVNTQNSRIWGAEKS